MKFAKSFLWNVSCKFLHRGWQVWAVDQIAAIETVGILEKHDSWTRRGPGARMVFLQWV